MVKNHRKVGLEANPRGHLVRAPSQIAIPGKGTSSILQNGREHRIVEPTQKQKAKQYLTGSTGQ